MAPAPVTVLILAPAPPAGAGPLGLALADARTRLAEHHRWTFTMAGASEARVVSEASDGIPFGARLRRLLGDVSTPGLIVLGAASIPLATPADRRRFVDAASADSPAALVNNAFSADVLAVAQAHLALRDVPASIRTDNALPRWLAEAARVPVTDLRARRRLAMDVDSPLDLLLLEGVRGAPALPRVDDDLAAPVRERLARIREVTADPGAELLVAGRTAAADLRWLERGTRSRTRALVEERGLRTASGGAAGDGHHNRRPPHSLLGMLFDRDGPERLGDLVSSLADGALVDTRVLLAHRLGADERAWPSAEDRFASDLLLAERIGDPWLRALTAAAIAAPVPILLGAHTLVGPGIRLALAQPRRASTRGSRGR